MTFLVKIKGICPANFMCAICWAQWCVLRKAHLWASLLTRGFSSRNRSCLIWENWGISTNFISGKWKCKIPTPCSFVHGEFWMYLSAFSWVEFVLDVWKPGGCSRWKWQSLWVGQMATRGGWVQWVSDSLVLVNFSTFCFDPLECDFHSVMKVGMIQSMPLLTYLDL